MSRHSSSSGRPTPAGRRLDRMRVAVLRARIPELRAEIRAARLAGLPDPCEGDRTLHELEVELADLTGSQGFE